MTTSSNTSLEKINWCKQQSKGIKISIENEKLSEEYLRTAKETLTLSKFSKQIGSRAWEATHKYYFLYFCAYAVLTNIGIKSEIHECTITLTEILEKEKLIKTKLSKYLLSAKKLRIDNQYYLKNTPVNIKENTLKEILLETERIIKRMTKEEKENARLFVSRL